MLDSVNDSVICCVPEGRPAGPPPPGRAAAAVVVGAAVVVVDVVDDAEACVIVIVTVVDDEEYDESPGAEIVITQVPDAALTVTVRLSPVPEMTHAALDEVNARFPLSRWPVTATADVEPCGTVGGLAVAVSG